MKTLNRILFLSIILSLTLASCGDDDEMVEATTGELNLNLSGLEDLGEDFAYEGWLIVDGAPVTTGVFNVDATGALTNTSFTLDKSDLDLATTFVLTIEPSPDPDPAPSAVHILAGDFSQNQAALTVNHAAAIATDFTASTGQYILATPTDGGSDTDENSGVWWLDPTGGPSAGLSLPELPEGWIYEGWAVVNGTPVSTGTFSDPNVADNFSGFSGAAGGPSYPGEDLLFNAPAGLDFPVDLSGGAVVISVEPVPDNSPAPFTLKPLVGPVPQNALDHTPYQMDNNALATNPTGSVSKDF